MKNLEIKKGILKGIQTDGQHKTANLKKHQIMLSCSVYFLPLKQANPFPLRKA